LYELLAGRLPIEMRELSLAEAVRVTREVDPRRWVWSTAPAAGT